MTLEELFARYAVAAVGGVSIGGAVFWAWRIARSEGRAFDALLERWVYAVAAIGLFLLFVGGVYRFATVGPANIGVDQVRSVSNATEATVLIHGWHGSSGMWDGTLHLLDDELGGRDVFLVSYASVTLEGGNRIEAAAQALAKMMVGQRYAKWTVIGHSLGGVIGRRAVVDYFKEGGSAEVSVITLGSPLAGTDLARGATELLRAPPDMVAHIQVGSSFLKELASEWRLLKQLNAVTHHCIGSTGDAVVPLQSALYLCDTCEPLTGVGHGQLVAVGDRSAAQAEALLRVLAARAKPCACDEAGWC